MHKLTYTFARMTALSLASKAGLHHITNIDADFHDETCSFYVYGTMYDLDRDTYPEGKALRVVRVADGAVDMIDGVLS